MHVCVFFAGGAEVGPLEREIDDLERQLVAERDEVNRLQGEWLKRQDDLVRLTTQRDSVLLQNELLRKETFIMERKRQRLDGEVEKRRTEIAKARKATEGIRGEISAVNARLHVDKSAHEQMDKENILIQAELVAMLKEAEEEALELEGEVERLEVEKKTLLEGLEEAHATNLSWEKKVRLAKELRESLKKETEGSTNTLRLDIHHMQVGV
jgi:chromosome segregation ATPase